MVVLDFFSKTYALILNMCSIGCFDGLKHVSMPFRELQIFCRLQIFPSKMFFGTTSDKCSLFAPKNILLGKIWRWQNISLSLNVLETCLKRSKQPVEHLFKISAYVFEKNFTTSMNMSNAFLSRLQFWYQRTFVILSKTYLRKSDIYIAEYYERSINTKLAGSIHSMRSFTYHFSRLIRRPT